MADDATQLLLGEIKGKMDLVIAGQTEIKQEISRLNARVGVTETSTAKYGVLAGAFAAVGIELIKKKIGM